MPRIPTFLNRYPGIHLGLAVVFLQPLEWWTRHEDSRSALEEARRSDWDEISRADLIRDLQRALSSDVDLAAMFREFRRAGIEFDPAEEGFTVRAWLEMVLEIASA